MRPSDFKLHQTGDGSGTLYSDTLQEAYHSLNGALQESKHVFIEAGLKACRQKDLHIFEIGFGTGLNALLSWGEAKHSGRNILYTAVEAFPLPLSVLSELGYESLEPMLPNTAFSQLHEAEWGRPTALEPNCFALCKLEGDFSTLSIPLGIDLVYFDAFAPDKQPEMWEEHLFGRLFDALNANGMLVTYCAKGEVRRRLQRCGFHVERIPGPPGKREMLRARKIVD